MKELYCIVCVLFTSLSAHALDREAFTFTKYDLNVRIEPEQQRLGVRGKITLRNDSSSPQRSLSLQISSSLNWSSIKLQGAPVEFLTQPYTSDIDHTGALSEAIVVLPQPVAPKQSTELEIGYEGVIQQDATRLTRIGVPDEKAKHADWDEISRTFTALRGIGYVAWYPVSLESVSLSDDDAVPNSVAKWKQREADTEMKVLFTISLSSAQEPTLFCTGPTTPVGYEQMGLPSLSRIQCNFGHLNSSLPLFVTGNFDSLQRPAVRISYLQDHKSGADDYAAAIDEVSPLVMKWFGDHRDNPQQKALAVDVPDSQSAPYESGNMLLVPLTGSDTKLLLAAGQQLTRLFFQSPHAWIHDGLANYAQARFIQEKEGRQAAIAYMEAHRSAMIESEKRAAAMKDGPALSDTSHETLSQTKAMYVWWMLRDIVGESAFDAALHSYKAADDNSPAYLQKLLETTAHRDLQWFFDDWVYHDRGLPDFRVDSVYPSKLGTGGYMVTVTVENLGGAAAEVPITLRLETGEASGRLVVPAKSKASTRIEAPSLPQEAIVNDGSVPESDTTNNQRKLN